MILSILIPTLPEEKHFLKELIININSQIVEHIPQGWLKVEILTDNRGREVSTGEKRNDLIQKARGIYTWFVDCDDFIFDYAIKDILDAAKHSPDVICFDGFMTTDGEQRVDFELRLGHPYKAIIKDGKEYYLRFPNHIVPMKRELIKNVLFEHVTIGEDYKWAKKINDLGLLETQAVINKKIYHYRYRSKK